LIAAAIGLAWSTKTPAARFNLSSIVATSAMKASRLLLESLAQKPRLIGDVHLAADVRPLLDDLLDPIVVG